MSPRVPAILLLLMSACANRPASPPLVLPKTIAGVWRQVATLESADMLRGVYNGPGVVSVDIYKTKSFNIAFDMAQRWRPQPDSVTFQKDRYFVVVKWEKAERDALKDFVRELEKIVGTAAAGRP